MASSEPVGLMLQYPASVFWRCCYPTGGWPILEREKSMTFGKKDHPWDEYKTVEEALDERV